MAAQNRISYGFAKAGKSENGYGPKKRMVVNKLATANKPISFSQIAVVTVPSQTFGTENSNFFERHHVGNMAVDQSSMENLRLWQLVWRVAYESKILYNHGAAKKSKEEPKIIGFRGQRDENDFFVAEGSAVETQFNALPTARVPGWAAENDYRIVNEASYTETWEAFTNEESDGEGRVFCFLESIPRDYNINELQHAAAYRVWIVFENGCGLDMNGQFHDVIFPPENRKKPQPIKHFDQYRFINNNEVFRQHVSNNHFKNDDILKVNISADLTEEGNQLAPTNIFNPHSSFNNVINHVVNGARKNVIPWLFPSAPDAKGFMVENYIQNGKFIVAARQREHMVELVTEDLKTEKCMKKYKPDVWLHYVLTRQQASILHSIGKAKEAVRGENFIMDDVTAALDNFSIDITKDFHLNGHGYTNIWPDTTHTSTGCHGKEWGEGNHDIMRNRTVYHHEKVPQFNDEMKQADTPFKKQLVFLKYFKDSLKSFSRVCVPEAIVDPATFSLINYTNILVNDHNYSSVIEPAWHFMGDKMQFTDVLLSKMATNLEYVRFVATQHWKIIQIFCGTGCCHSLLQEKSHYTLQGRSQAGKSNALENVKQMKTPGTVQDLTHASALATLDHDCFNTIVMEHEQNPNAVGQGGKGRTNDQLKVAETRKNMKTKGENTSTRLERKGKDTPMQTVVTNTVHSKCFVGCTNRKLSERDEASRSRDCELTMPMISRIGKGITTCRNAEQTQSHATRQAGEKFLFQMRTFDIFEYRVRAMQDQPLLMPQMSTLVWNDVLEHLQENLDKITDINNLVRGKGRMLNTCTTLVIFEAYCILFLYEPSDKVCRFYIDEERVTDGPVYDILVEKQPDQNGLHAEQEVELFIDEDNNVTTKMEDGNGEDAKVYMVNKVKGTIHPIEGSIVKRSESIANFSIKWEYENEYFNQHSYAIGDIVRYRYRNVIYTLECDRQPSVEPILGNYWEECEVDTDDIAEWDAEKEYEEGDIVEMDDVFYFKCNKKHIDINPIQNTTWKVVKREMESLLGKYYEQNFDFSNPFQQYDIGSLLYVTVPNAITTCGMNQDEILSQSLSKFIKQLCTYGKMKLKEVENSEAKRYNHCMPNNRDDSTSGRNQVEVDYIALGEDYISGITKLLEKNFTPGFLVTVDDVFIEDCIAQIIEQRTKHVQKIPDTVRVKDKYFKVENTMTGTREIECDLCTATTNGKLNTGFIHREEWQHWQTTRDLDGNYSGGWKAMDLDSIRVDHDKPKKRKIQIKRVGNMRKYFIYVPWIYQVTRTREEDPFLNALGSYKFKSNTADETMEILLGTPYEGKVTTGRTAEGVVKEEITCIPWVSNKVVLTSDTERKIIHKHGQVIPEAADLINMHLSECAEPEEEIIIHIDQYANLYHQKNQMYNAQLQDVVFDQNFANAFKHCCKYSLLKEAHAKQDAGGGYKMQDFPRELADKGFKDQIAHLNKKKRGRELPTIRENEETQRPRVQELSF